jgi:outer membrane protein
MMKFTITIFTYFFLLSNAALVSAQDQDLTLSYEEAVNIALRENIQIMQQENILQTSQAEKAQTYANLAPSVNFSATGQQVFGRQFDNTSGNFTSERVGRMFGGLNANFVIFNGFSRINSIRQTQKAAEAQLYQINQTRQDVIFEVSQQYLQVLLNQELLRIAEANLEQQQKLAESIETFVKAGIRNIADQYNQESAAKNTALEVVERKNQLTISKVRLIRILQIDPFKEWQFTETGLEQSTLIQQQVSLEEAYNAAIAHRPDIKHQRNTIEASQYGLKAARGNYYPRLSVGYYLGSQYSSLFNPTLSEQLLDINRVNVVSLDLSIPIFNNLQNATAIQRSRQQLNNAELAMEDLERNIFEQVQTATADYETAKERIAAAEAQVKAAEKALEAEKERFKLGVGNILDLNRVNAAYVEALATKAQADYQIIFQKTALDYFMGKLSNY